MGHVVYLSIGSNKGDTKNNLDQAINSLNNNKNIILEKVSPFYRTQPQNYVDQDWFLNAVLKIKTDLGPEVLLKFLKDQEKQIDTDGKVFRFGPRVIDLDIIYYDDLIFKSKELEIPHPRMHERCFVLIPLCDIGRDMLHPVYKLKPDELLKKIEKQETQEVLRL